MRTKHKKAGYLGGFRQKLTILFLIISIPTAFYILNRFSQKTSSGQPEIKQASASSGICKAGTPSGLKTCISQVQNGTVGNIEITSTISCADATTCSFLIDGVRSPVVIYGTTAKNGFKRSKKFNYSFRVANSDAITFKDLTFTDSSDSCDPLNEGLCAPMLFFNDSTNITLDHLTMTKAKRTAVAINAGGTPTTFTIQNSTFTSEAAHAITTYIVVPGGWGKIINNTFTNTASNAIAFNLASALDAPSIIQGNTFTHNHKSAIYHSCGSTGTEPCPGGQLYFSPGAKNVTISDNIFKDGYADVNTANSDVGVAGIEIMHNNNHAITVANNLFVHNSTGIMLNYDTSMTNLSDGITIRDNYFTNNMKNDTYFFNYPSSIDLTRNNYQGFTSNPVSGSAVLRAWGYIPSGVGTIPVLIDGKTLGNAQVTNLNLNHPDKAHIYQASYNFQTQNYSNGTHKIKISGLESTISFSWNFKN